MNEWCCVLLSVIDFCLTKTMLCDPITNYPSLQLQWASKGNCQQRKGATLCLLLNTIINIVYAFIFAIYSLRLSIIEKLAEICYYSCIVNKKLA